MTARGVRPTTGGSGPVVEMLFGLTILAGAVWTVLSAVRARTEPPQQPDPKAASREADEPRSP